MFDDHKQKLILGTLLVASLGMGSWYLTFGGDERREAIATRTSEKKPDRHAGTEADGKRNRRVRQPAVKQPLPKRPVRIREQEENRRKKDRHEPRRILKKEQKVRTPLAAAPVIGTFRIA